MFFRKKPKNYIDDAIHKLSHAITIAYLCKQNKHFMPTPEDLLKLKHLSVNLQEGLMTVQYITQCMQQRMQGKPEASAKWHNKETFDYHYPE